MLSKAKQSFLSFFLISFCLTIYRGWGLKWTRPQQPDYVLPLRLELYKVESERSSQSQAHSLTFSTLNFCPSIRTYRQHKKVKLLLTAGKFRGQIHFVQYIFFCCPLHIPKKKSTTKETFKIHKLNTDICACHIFLYYNQLHRIWKARQKLIKYSKYDIYEVEEGLRETFHPLYVALQQSA